MTTRQRVARLASAVWLLLGAVAHAQGDVNGVYDPYQVERMIQEQQLKAYLHRLEVEKLRQENQLRDAYRQSEQRHQQEQQYIHQLEERIRKLETAEQRQSSIPEAPCPTLSDRPLDSLLDSVCREHREVSPACYGFDWQSWVKDSKRSLAGADFDDLEHDTGTQAPARFAVEFPDHSIHVVFAGCRSHSCPSADAFTLVDSARRRLNIAWRSDTRIRYLGPDARYLQGCDAYEWLRHTSEHAISQLRTNQSDALYKNCMAACQKDAPKDDFYADFRCHDQCK